MRQTGASKKQHEGGFIHRLTAAVLCVLLMLTVMMPLTVYADENGAAGTEQVVRVGWYGTADFC
ncbi:MAG: hypothetical protein Q4B73_08980 [Lachnospiraceae bacterium]|nr:hypothetical protein [Lachnospiraceae bacterium]